MIGQNLGRSVLLMLTVSLWLCSQYIYDCAGCLRASKEQPFHNGSDPNFWLLLQLKSHLSTRVCPGFSIGGKREGTRAKSGGSAWKGAATPPHQLWVRESAVSSQQDSGRSPDCPIAYTIFSMQNDLSWHYNILWVSQRNCTDSRTLQPIALASSTSGSLSLMPYSWPTSDLLLLIYWTKVESWHCHLMMQKQFTKKCRNKLPNFSWQISPA